MQTRPDDALHRAKSKSPAHALSSRLVAEAGLSWAQCRIALEILADHLEDYFVGARDPGAIVHTAVHRSEPAGKPIKDCRVVPVKLSVVLEDDLELRDRRGFVALRMARLRRLCEQAREQGGLLSHEDLSLLLGIDPSTVRDLVGRWRSEGVIVPTRGAVKDIGPEPSHKRQIAELLGRGYTTSEIRANTGHSERSIARYQQQFGLVLYLLHHYPDASLDEYLRLSDLSVQAFETYREVRDALAERPECQAHMERLRRRYELDPHGFAQKPPEGKRAADSSRKRLEAQTFCNAMRQALQEDLDLTSRVSELVTGDLMKLVRKAYQLSEAPRPGELLTFVDAHEPALFSGEQPTDRKVVPVLLPLCTDEALELWRADEPLRRRRARIAVKLAMAAYEQGGVTTVAKLAELLHTSTSNLSRDLRDLAVECHQQAPTKGLIEDAGPTLTHKDWIVGLDQCGLTGEEIAWLTRHAPRSRDRYIATFRRAETLMKLEGKIPEPEDLARVLRLRKHVAKQYVDLLHEYHGDRGVFEACTRTMVDKIMDKFSGSAEDATEHSP